MIYGNREASGHCSQLLHDSLSERVASASLINGGLPDLGSVL